MLVVCQPQLAQLAQLGKVSEFRRNDTRQVWSDGIQVRSSAGVWPNSDGIIPTTCWPYTHNIVNLERLPTSQGTDTAQRPDSAVTSSRSRLDSLLIPTSELETPSNSISSHVSNLHVLTKLRKSTICTVQGKVILKGLLRREKRRDRRLCPPSCGTSSVLRGS